MNVVEEATAKLDDPAALPWDTYAGPHPVMWSALIHNPATPEWPEYFILFRPAPGVGPGGLLNYAIEQGVTIKFMVAIPDPRVTQKEVLQ